MALVAADLNVYVTAVSTGAVQTTTFSVATGDFIAFHAGLERTSDSITPALPIFSIAGASIGALASVVVTADATGATQRLGGFWYAQVTVGSSVARVTVTTAATAGATNLFLHLIGAKATGLFATATAVPQLVKSTISSPSGTNTGTDGNLTTPGAGLSFLFVNIGGTATVTSLLVGAGAVSLAVKAPTGAPGGMTIGMQYTDPAAVTNQMTFAGSAREYVCFGIELAEAGAAAGAGWGPLLGHRRNRLVLTD